MGIDQEHAVRTALRLLDEEGLDRLSLRRIAAELNVKAPALYWHFANKRMLLDRVTDLMLGPAAARLTPPGDPGEWPGWLLAAAEGMRDALLAHRDGARVALGANLGYARAFGTFVERAAEVLHAAGFGLADASRAGGAFVHFVVGRLVEEQELPKFADRELEFTRGLYPTLAAGMMERAAMGETQAEAFRYGVGIVIAGLQALHRDL